MRFLVLILAFLSIFACSDDSARQEYQEFTYPEVIRDSIPTLEGNEKLTLSVSYELPQMPEANCDQFTVTMKFHIHGDSIESYDIHTSCYQLKPEELVEENVIRKGDTKIKIARRLGVSPDRILNKDPLRVGEKIRIQ